MAIVVAVLLSLNVERHVVVAAAVEDFSRLHNKTLQLLSLCNSELGYLTLALVAVVVVVVIVVVCSLIGLDSHGDTQQPYL